MSRVTYSMADCLIVLRVFLHFHENLSAITCTSPMQARTMSAAALSLLILYVKHESPNTVELKMIARHISVAYVLLVLFGPGHFGTIWSSDDSLNVGLQVQHSSNQWPRVTKTNAK